MDDDAGSTQRPAARWRVRLKGEAPDLEDLVELVTAPGLRVVKEGGDFFLTSATFERLSGSVEVLEEAERLLTRLNGAGKLKRQAFRDVDVDGQVMEFSAMHGVARPATVQARARVPAPTILVGGQPVSPRPGTLETDRWLELAERDPNVAEALATFDRPHDWVNLYRVLEIIEGRADIVGSGWASGNEIKRFKRTANHPGAAGPDARHARSSAESPPRPMRPEEGIELIRRIVTDWFGSLIASES